MAKKIIKSDGKKMPVLEAKIDRSISGEAKRWKIEHGRNQQIRK